MKNSTIKNWVARRRSSSGLARRIRLLCVASLALLAAALPAQALQKTAPGGENASLASSTGTWSGLDTQPRSLSIVAGGDILIGTTHPSLSGGTIWLVAGGSLDIGESAAIDVGGSGIVALFESPNNVLPREPIIVIVPSPIAEPTAAALMLVSLLGPAGFAARRAKAEG